MQIVVIVMEVGSRYDAGGRRVELVSVGVRGMKEVHCSRYP